MSSNTISILSGATARAHEIRAGTRASEVEAEKTANANEHGNALPVSGYESPEKQQRLMDAISELKGFVQNIRRNLEFSIDDESGRIVIKVIDSESKEVIRQIPPEEAVQLARALDGTKDGTILKAKA